MIRAVKERMRLYLLMPAHPEDAAKSCIGVGSCVRLPALHCAFAGCQQTWNLEDLVPKGKAMCHCTSSGSCPDI